MAKKPINTLKGWFITMAKPLQDQFWDWMDSFWHKDTIIPQESVENLVLVLNNLVSKTTFDSFEQGELIPYNANATYVIPAGYLLESIIPFYGVAGTMKLSKVVQGDEDTMDSTDINMGWNQPLVLNIVAENATNLFINGIPNGSKIIFIKRKLKMA